MHWPYTLDFLDSFMAAQIGAALLLTAVLVFWRIPPASRVLLFTGIWLAAVSMLVDDGLRHLGFRPGPELAIDLLLLTAGLGGLAAVFALRPVVTVLSALGVWGLWWLDHFVQQSDGELAALHLAWLGLLAGLLGREPRPRTSEAQAPEGEPSYLLHDLFAFLGGTSLAALVCLLVMHRRDGSADEWGYTYQAAVFAKGRLYATAPRCEHFLESFYVFESSGRLFSQYTPGWPLFLVPFVWARALWLSGPVSMGLLSWSMARLGRSVMRAHGAAEVPPSAREVRAAGTWAALLSTLATSLITNGASRYAHVYVLALYAWSLEALMQITIPGLPRRRQILWGLVLGTASVHAVAARPADGAFAGIGLAALFLVALARRRVGWRAFAASAGAFAVWTALVLVILRVQLGKWFTTGYSLNAVIHPWNVVKYSKPAPNQWKYGLPLATGAYCWWPTSFPLGLAGLARMRGRALGLLVAMVIGCVPYVVYCMYLDLGQRGYDWGYGPRYLMILVVPLALGGAVALATPTVAALSRASAARSALARGAPLALAAFAVAWAWVRIAPMHWATVYEHTWRHSALARAIDEAHLRNAIVIAADGTTGFSSIDLTTNYPLDLYPDQNVIIAVDRQEPQQAEQCLRDAFPGRRIYRASGLEDVRITPAR